MSILGDFVFYFNVGADLQVNSLKNVMKDRECFQIVTLPTHREIIVWS